MLMLSVKLLQNIVLCIVFSGVQQVLQTSAIIIMMIIKLKLNK
jgi:hypothetical protein